MKANLQMFGGRGGGSGLSGGSAGGGEGAVMKASDLRDAPAGTKVTDENGTTWTKLAENQYGFAGGWENTRGEQESSGALAGLSPRKGDATEATGGFVSRENQPADIRQSIAQMQVKRETSPRGVSKVTRNEIGSRLDGATNTGDTLAIKGRENSVYYTKVGKNKWSFGSGEGGTPHDSGYILENLTIMGGEIVYKKKK